MSVDWSPADVGDLAGRTALVTGGSSGLGLEAAAVLASAGARVLITSRDPGRGERAVALLRARVPSGDVTALQLDLADLSSVRALASELVTGVPRLDVLLDNAGVMAVPRSRTADGFERQFATNHLGHFALTGLLLPLLAPGSRVVAVSSLAAHQGRLRRDDLMQTRRYTRWGAYAQAKLANLLFVAELARRVEQVPPGEPGHALVATAAHPGVSGTNLFAAGPLGRLGPAGRLLGRAGNLLLQPAAHGAWPLLRAATDPSAAPGEYFGPSGPGQTRGSAVRVPQPARALDPGDARWLWDESARLTGVDWLS